jgi:hypothetical protein
MKKETYEALKSVTEKSRKLLEEKYQGRKRLKQDEVWEQAVMYRDLFKIESWIDKVTEKYN